MNNKSVTIVCAQYKKDISFLQEFQPHKYKIVVIKKGRDVVNKAHEATSYLKYIIDNYYNLSDITVFIHDENKSWHHNGNLTDSIPTIINKNPELDYIELNKPTINNEGIRLGEKLTNFITQVFGNQFNIERNLPLHRKCCSQFIVSRKRILKHSREFYQRYFNWLISNTHGTGNGDKNNPYSGYNTSRYAEYTWYGLFN